MTSSSHWGGGWSLPPRPSRELPGCPPGRGSSAMSCLGPGKHRWSLMFWND